MKKFFFTVALAFGMANANAAMLGQLFCGSCEMASPATPAQLQGTTAAANSLFPLGFRPSFNDTVYVCNGQFCAMQRYDGSKWVLRSDLVVIDDTISKGRNYINVDDAVKPKISGMPMNWTNSTYVVSMTGEWRTRTGTVTITEGPAAGQTNTATWEVFVVTGIQFTLIQGGGPGDTAINA